MRIVIAPDKFKACLSAEAVCSAIQTGLRSAFPNAQFDLCPMADGGEGTVSALVAATHGRLLTRRVTSPLPEMKVDATFGFLGDGKTAVIEMAAASGLALLAPAERNPMATTTFGTGELMCAAAEMGATKIILGIGGSATIDCGIGMAQACGLPVLLACNEQLSPTEPLTGRDLEKVVFIKHGRGGKVDRVPIEVACDVTNPLADAAPVFGPQKGATAADVAWFSNQHRRLAERTGNQAIAALPGTGAAGGAGFALAAFFGAKLRPGFEIIMEATKLADRLKDADLCITGEGRLDTQSLSGKAPIGVARLCKSLGVPCIAIVGSVADGAENFTECHPISTSDMSLEESMRRAPELIAQAAAKISLPKS